MRYIVFILGGVALFYRPAFSITLFSYLLIYTGLIQEVTGYRGPTSSYIPPIEFCLFLSLTLIAQNLFLKRLSSSLNNKLLIVTFWGMAGHFSNYFYSSIKKMNIGHSFTDWLIYNDIFDLTLVGDVLGILPLHAFKFPLEVIFDNLTPFLFLISLSTLLLQLSTLGYFLNKKFLLTILILLDLMHVSIFLLSGIFFYKWILINVLLFVLLKDVERKHFGFDPICFLALIFGPYLFSKVHLGWFDSKAFVNKFVVATDLEGKRIKLPTNHFLISSTTYGQGRITNNNNGHFSTSTMGGIYEFKSYDEFFKIKECQSFIHNGNEGVITPGEKEQLVSNITKYHQFYLNHSPTLSFLYPHHFYSIPSLYPDYFDIDFSRIKSYELVIESICLSFYNKSVQTNTLKKDIVKLIDF